MIKKTFIEMDYGELEDLIKKTYGHTYEFVAEEELMNDVDKTYSLTAKTPLDEWEAKDMEEFKLTGKTKGWRTNTIMQDMINNDVLEPGEYLIHVSW